LKNNKRGFKDQPGQKLVHHTFEGYTLIHTCVMYAGDKNKKHNTALKPRHPYVFHTQSAI
jgi:hypothetical protein